MELRQSDEWGRFLGTLGWQTEIIDGCAVRSKKLGPLGSVIKIQRPESLPLEEIEILARKKKALFVKIEPLSDSQVPSLVSSHYSPDLWPLTPSRTVIIDLSKSSEELLLSFSKDTRQSIKKSVRESISPIVYSPTSSKEFDQGLKIFYDLFKQTGREKGFWIPPIAELRNKCQSFGADCFLILTFRTNQRIDSRTSVLPLSGILMLVYENNAYYHHAASAKLGQLLKAPYLALWEAIKTAKALGCQRMDLEGIFDPRFASTFKKWVGFSAFKLKWGGQVMEYPPTYTKFFNPWVKLLFRFAK